MKRDSILDQALMAARQHLGLKCTRKASRGGDRNFDAEIEIEDRNGRKHCFVAEVKQRVDRREQIAQALASLAEVRRRSKSTGLPMLITSYMSRSLAGECRRLNLGFLDTAGNAYIEVPETFVLVTGHPAPPKPPVERMRSATLTSTKIAYALLSDPPLVSAPYREIARAAGVALGAVGPALKDLAARKILSAGQLHRLLEPHLLLDQWAANYPTVLRPKLHPRMYQADPERLLNLDLEKLHAYWGGEVAAQRLTGHLRPERYTIYAERDVQRLIVEGRMRIAEAEGNVQILDAFWPEDQSGRKQRLAPPLVVYADLMMTGEPRNIETARLIHEQHLAPILHSSGPATGTDQRRNPAAR